MANKSGDIKVIEFQREFPTINIDLMKNNPKDYDMSMLVAYTLETERGFMVKKVGKTYKKGTKITYKPFESKEEVINYRTKLDELLEEYNTKYDTNHHWE